MVYYRQRADFPVRSVKMIENFDRVYNVSFKERYRCKLLNTAIFQDFETALDAVLKNYNHASNDNESMER